MYISESMDLFQKSVIGISGYPGSHQMTCDRFANLSSQQPTKVKYKPYNLLGSTRHRRETGNKLDTLQKEKPQIATKDRDTSARSHLCVPEIELQCFEKRMGLDFTIIEIRPCYIVESSQGYFLMSKKITKIRYLFMRTAASLKV